MIKPLTSLRFFAALMVLADHYFGFQAGFAGVTFFYVLSGFIMTINYGHLDSWQAVRSFWWKRFARIYPTHLLLLLVCIPLGSTAALLPNLFLLHAWVPAQGVYFSFDKPSWSISDEAFFYAMFPALMLLLTRTRLFVWGGALFVAAWVLTDLHPNWTLDGPLYSLPVHGLQFVPATYLFYVFPPVRLFEFALGIGIARWAYRGGLGTMPELSAVAVAVASVAIFYAGPSAPFAASILYIPAAWLLVYVFSKRSGAVSVLLSRPLLVLLGDSSFMLYMIHWPLAQYVHVSPWLLAPVAVGLSVALHLWFERPVQKWLRSLGQQGSPGKYSSSQSLPQN